MDVASVNSVPAWVSVKEFTAEEPVADTVSKYVNQIVFGIGASGLYAAAVLGPNMVVVGMLGFSVLAARKVVSAGIGYVAYPIALKSLSESTGFKLARLASDTLRETTDHGYISSKITFHKSGTKYNGLLIGHKSTIVNGKWTINALGQMQAFEPFIKNIVNANQDFGSNTLLINGPSVSSSSGWPTRYQFGAGFEAGIQFLESIVKATHIILKGHSLGAGMLSEAILQHDFSMGLKNNIKYLSICDRSFSTLSAIASMHTTSCVLPLFYFSGQELDNIAAARKLSEMGILQIVIQRSIPNGEGGDRVIPDCVAAAYVMRQQGITKNKVFLESREILHGNDLPNDIMREQYRLIPEFLAS